ncbi:MAG: HNH/ENDO VII family nuclease [Turicibacter sp.]|nr:HNH/ENDO VII family nuclease [Turicibacter sp.]
MEIITAALSEIAEAIASKSEITKFWEGLDEKFTNPIMNWWDNLDSYEQGLSMEEKIKLKHETGWSNEIIDAIESREEAEIFKKAGLIDGEINGKKCLLRGDIDLNQLDEKGRTNSERMEKGLAPLDRDGRSIELHHIGQKSDAPLAELTHAEHHSNGNDGILHDKTKESEIDRQGFDKERQEHWKSRGDNKNG